MPATDDASPGRPLRVALNLVFLTPGEVGGMETYARELLPRLADAPGVEPVAIVGEGAARDRDAPWAQAMPMAVAPVDERDRKQWVWGEQRHVPRLAAGHGADVVHSLASTGPVSGPQVRVTTVHDLNYAVVPEAHFGIRSLGMRVLIPAAVRASRRVIADSASTAADLATHLGHPADRTDVVLLGGGERGEPAATPTPERELRERLGLGERPVLLSLSAQRPHKNVEALIDAIAAIPPGRRPLLVVPGYRTEHGEVLLRRALARGAGDDLRLPGWLPAADVEGLWALCAAHVFASHYEGFGLPVLEALRRGVPSATSDRASLPEIAGDAALMFDPDDGRGVREAIERLLADAPLRERLAAAGPERAATFTWERAAEQTVASYRRAVGA